MKTLLYTCCLLLVSTVYSQTWHTNTTYGVGVTLPGEAFKINPYQNDLWFLNDHTNTANVMCLHLNTGEVDTVFFTVCPSLCDKDVAFTSNYTYLSGYYSGLYRVNNDYSFTNVYNNVYVDYLSQNNDTIYMALIDDSQYLSYTSNGSIISSPGFRRITAKGNFKYSSYSFDGSLQKYTGQTSDGYEAYSSVDAEHICGLFHDIKFSPYSDTIYVACTAGISLGYNYDFNDSITPNNTTDMPSANVLEFEFDLENHIWACFGDANDVPFAFARLDGDTWTNRFDNTNCPVSFSNYHGMEIDTIGNIWIAESNKVHTLSWGNAPQWLGVNELQTLQFSVSPNPTHDVFTLEVPEAEGYSVRIFTPTGQEIVRFDAEDTMKEVDLSTLPQGVYIVNVQTATETGIQQVVKW
ncbi:MAG TPA: T9SS type A sorting domain-containing protein [Fluviicola sp.]|nr:T9SS type A sorting domain-containing protein [Fluviicola sp.]